MSDKKCGGTYTLREVRTEQKEASSNRHSEHEKQKKRNQMRQKEREAQKDSVFYFSKRNLELNSFVVSSNY